MIAIRWAATLIFLGGLALAFATGGSWLLWAFTVAMFAVAGWAWGASIDGPWSERIEEDHPDALGSLDMLERYGTTRKTTAGGTPPPTERATSPDA